MRGGGTARAATAAAIVAIGVLWPAAPAVAKDYSFPEVRIEAAVLPDGTLEVEERRTFRFEGTFSEAFFTIEHWPGLIEDFRVARDGEPVEVQQGRYGERFEATWPAPATDEDVTFTISYRARCAVDAYPDTAHLLWQFVGRGWEKPTGHLLVTLRLPGRSSLYGHGGTATPCGVLSTTPPAVVGEAAPLGWGDVRAWAHGPLGGEVRFADPQTVTFEVRDLPPRTFVEGSVLFPVETVPHTYQQPVRRRDAILAEESALAEAANRARVRHLRNRGAARLLLVAAPLLALGIVLLSRRRDRVPGVPRYLEEPPDDTHPAELAHAWATLHKRPPTPIAYRTQLLNLAATGAIEIEPVGRATEPTDLRLRRTQTPAPGLDEEFVQFLFPDGDEPVQLKSIRATGSRATELKEWSALLTTEGTGRIAKVIRTRTRFESWTLAALAAGVAAWSVLAGALSMLEALLAAGAGLLAGAVVRVVPALVRNPAAALLGLVFIALVGVPTLLPLWFLLREGGGVFLGEPHAAVVVAFAAWVVAMRFVRELLPPDLQERIERWRSFRRYLREFSSLPDAPAMAITIWERYLVYATALGVAEEVEKQVTALVPPEELGSPFAGAPRGIEGMHTFRSFSTTRIPATAYSQLAASSGSGGFSSGVGSFSSGGGFGGGFSGGGGGGGGGTGGGAR